MHCFSRFTTVSRYDRRKFHLKRKPNREDRVLVHHKVIDMKFFSFCFIFTFIVIFFYSIYVFFFAGQLNCFTFYHIDSFYQLFLYLGPVLKLLGRLLAIQGKSGGIAQKVCLKTRYLLILSSLPCLLIGDVLEGVAIEL